MFIKSLRLYGSNFLPPSVLEGIFIFMIGLLIVNPYAFITSLIVGSIYGMVLTSVYYVWNGFLTLAPLV